MDLTYDEAADAAYLTLGKPLEAGESAAQVPLIDIPNGDGQVTIDVDSRGRILGFEILFASQALRPDVLKRARGQADHSHFGSCTRDRGAVQSETDSDTA